MTGGENERRDGEVFNQAASQDSDFIPDGTGMKNQNNKTEINRWRPRGVQAPRRWEEDGTQRCELPRSPSPNKGLLPRCFSRRRVFLWQKYFRSGARVSQIAFHHPLPRRKCVRPRNRICGCEHHQDSRSLRAPFRKSFIHTLVRVVSFAHWVSLFQPPSPCLPSHFQTQLILLDEIY